MRLSIWTSNRAGLKAAVALLIVSALLAHGPVLALDPNLKLNQFHLTNWTARDSSAFSGIYAIAQTPDGFLWLGTARGLYRFDGVRAEPVGKDQIRDKAVTALATDSHGNLWIGLANGVQVARLTPASEVTVFDIPTTGMLSPVISIVPDPDGSIWIATRDNVHHFDGERWRVIDDPWPLTAAAWSDPGGVWAMILAPDGTVWSKNLLGLYYLRRDAKAFEQADGYAGGLLDFARDPEGRVWTSDFSARRFYSLPELKAGEPVRPPQLGAPVPPSMVGLIRIDRDGAIWNANRVTNFLYRSGPPSSPGATERFTPRDGLTADIPSTVFEDRQGNIWVPTEAGLSRFRNANIVVERDVEARMQVNGMVATPAGVYVYSGRRAAVPDPDGDPGGRLYRIRPGQTPEVVDADIGQLTAIAGSPDGSLVISRDDGLFRWREGRLTPIPLPAQVQDGHVVDIAQSGDTIFVSFHQKGIYRLSSGSWTDITPPQVTAQHAANIAVDAAGAVWAFYTSDRMLRIDGDRVTELTHNLGRLEAIVPDRDGMIMLATHGLARFSGGSLKTISSSRIPGLTRAYGAVQSADDRVWIVTPSGVAHIDRTVLLKAFADSSAPVDFDFLDSSDGFTGVVPSELFNALVVAGPDGRIWFFMHSNVGWIDSNHLHENPVPIAPVITAVKVNAQEYAARGTLMLPAGTSQLEIDYTSPSLAMPERVRFRYKLVGLDEDWIDAGGRRQAFYTNLPAGSHRFEVMASNNDGVWNEQVTSLSLTIAPTFVQSNWFKLLIVIGAASVAWLAYRMLLNQQAARLLRRFEIRIAERERIARELHDTLLQSVQGLILRFDSVAARIPPDGELYAPTQDAIRRAEAVVAEGRDRVRELRKTAKAGLGQSIIEISNEIIASDGPQFTLMEQGPQRVLHALVLDEILRIAGEALRNTVQHAHATALNIAVSYGEAELLMRIQDDGVGIPQEYLTKVEKPNHYGLVGMQERAQRIGARLGIHNREGGGTVITLTVPARAAYRDQHGFWRRLLRERESVSKDAETHS